MLNWLFKARRARGDVDAARRGPQAAGRRAGGRIAQRLVGRLFRGR